MPPPPSITPAELRAAHQAAQDKVLAQRSKLVSSASSPAAGAVSFPLDNISEGTWTLFSPQLLSHLPPSWFEAYDQECDEWVLEFYDTDFANELYPGSFQPGELLATLHVGERHVRFEPVRRPAEVVAGEEDGGLVELVQTFKHDGAAAPTAAVGVEDSSSSNSRRKVTAKLRLLGDGFLTIAVPLGDLLPGKKGDGEDGDKEEIVTLYGTFEEDGEDEFEYVAAGEGGDW
ncbi:uncharacterized protein B0I36DRAFT_108536 [Microdochium trichocladiopsis]|uniref:Uncharacterized protein n=1 Tax=Microdochium trichocladiopsis TaxID=1682393 RepID=A0A9P8Y9Y1_9PEZI|nr:uncharacterized protein B0I36DRAFT_108536 [Microdochium trichocladiopsis]KAH7033396.1 hypothetical protein B0I36DRAFT_108536 [Microdochium trichocladiopsis]